MSPARRGRPVDSRSPRARGATRLLLIDDQILVRAGIRALLERMRGVEVVAETGDADAALGLVTSHRPHLALVHLSMLGLRGLDLISRIGREVPACRVIAYSMSGRGQEVLEALRAGAAGYLLTLARPDELESALRAALRGETYLGPRIAHHVAEAARDRAGAPDGIARLTARQRDVLRYIAEGLGTKEIADRLKIGVRTVETHRANLRERLDLHDVAGLVRFAIVHGLVKGG